VYVEDSTTLGSYKSEREPLFVRALAIEPLYPKKEVKEVLELKEETALYYYKLMKKEEKVELMEEKDIYTSVIAKLADISKVTKEIKKLFIGQEEPFRLIISPESELTEILELMKRYLEVLLPPPPPTPVQTLEEIREKMKNEQTLSFDDIQKINEILKSTSDEIILDEIFRILESDIKLRKIKFGIDCIKELYRGEELLPQELRTPRPRRGDRREQIDEMIRAIVLNEYKRLHRLTGLKFIDGKIEYDEYLRKTREYAIIANRLYPR